MDSIRINNLRSLKDTGYISVKKINILVGNNSSGKSTFLRVFPLLKQSFNKKLNGPILWCGDDDDYVDFGSFKEALNYNSDDKKIRIGFKVHINYLEEYYRFEGNSKKEDFKESTIEFCIESDNNGKDYISEMKYRIEQYNLVVTFHENTQIKEIFLNKKPIEVSNNIEKETYFSPFYDQNIFDISLSKLRNISLSNLKAMVSFSESEENEFRFIDSVIEYIVLKKIFKHNLKKGYGDKIVKKVNEIYEKENIDLIEQWAFMFNLPIFFLKISDYLKTYFRNVYYIAPVRATAERYYRLRNAAVNEVDCRGKNLPVFLNSLSDSDFNKFQEWTKKYLGFEVVKTTSEGHVSLKIKREGQERAVNLSDTGFGYSQILPIVTQIWYIAKNAEKKDLRYFVHNSNIPATIVIEQPELHLHPALQAKLIDIIIIVARRYNVNFVIETHSETVINRVGSSISKGEISNTDTGVIIFEKNFGEDDTNIIIGGYDSEGYLNNWPLGFFEPEGE